MAKTGINLKLISSGVLVLFALIAAFVLKTRQSALRVNTGSDISSQYAQDGGVIYLNTAKDVKYIGSVVGGSGSRHVGPGRQLQHI